MIYKVCGVAVAAIAVIGASADQRLFAVVLAALFLVSLLKISWKIPEERILAVSLTGFPCIFTAGHPIVAGILTVLLILLVLELSGRPNDRESAIGSVAAGVLATVIAFQLYTLVPLLIVGVLFCLGVFYLFVRSYRLQTSVEGEMK